MACLVVKVCGDQVGFAARESGTAVAKALASPDCTGVAGLSSEGPVDCEGYRALFICLEFREEFFHKLFELFFCSDFLETAVSRFREDAFVKFLCRCHVNVHCFFKALAFFRRQFALKEFYEVKEAWARICYRAQEQD